MGETFGARMRQRREELHIALATIAECTKIKQSLLEAMERDDVSNWPTGIFRRAFIRAYAQSINLDPDVVVREFVERYPDPSEAVATPEAIAAAVDAGRGAAGSSARLRSMLGSAIGSLSLRRRSSTTGSLLTRDVVPLRDARPLALPRSVPHQITAEPAPIELTRIDDAQIDDTQVDDLQIEDLRIDDTPAVSTRPEAVSEPDFGAVAELCTELARVENTQEVRPLFADAARMLDAVGMVLWVWDGAALRPALSHGYSDRVLAQMPSLKRDADNVTAVAFRSGETCAIEGADEGNGALAIPLVTPTGPAGVLAIELRGSVRKSVRAAAMIIAAQLSQLTSGADRTSEDESHDEVIQAFAAPLLRAGAC